MVSNITLCLALKRHLPFQSYSLCFYALNLYVLLHHFSNYESGVPYFIEYGAHFNTLTMMLKYFLHGR
jgi:hypothetical protein